MKTSTAMLLCLAPFALAACGQGDHDPATTTAPVDAVTSNPAAQSPQAPTPAQGAPSYQQDSGNNVADRVDTTTTQDMTTTDPLAACNGLDTTQRSDCELRVRQGLDPAAQDAAQGVAATPATPPTDRATPPDALPVPADDSTAETADDDER